MERRILCYGDSNTWGYTPGTALRYPKNVRWTGVLQSLMGPDWEILEEGLGGRTTAFDRESDPYVNGLKGIGYALKTTRPLDGVVVMLGINDLVDRTPEESQEGIRKVLSFILDANRILNVSSPVYPEKPQFLLIGTPTFHPSIEEPERKSKHKGKYQSSCRLSPLYREVADDLGIAFLDGTLFAQASPIDGIHFTPESHLALAEAISKKLKELFEEA